MCTGTLGNAFWALVALYVFLTLGWPLFFSQQRSGFHNRIFTLYKFRTMSNQHDEHGRLLADEFRVPRAGALLRRTKLDELPQFLNVLRGEMSLVGPRPLLIQYLERYSIEQNRRHEVKPGITGLAQVSGGNRLSWEQKFELDVRYVDNLSWMQDVKIVLRTGLLIIRRLGGSTDEVTATEFEGAKSSVNHQ